MSAYLNALRAEGSREDLLREVERQWTEAMRLRAENAGLREVLDTYSCDCAEGCCEVGTHDDTICGHRARAALKAKETRDE